MRRFCLCLSVITLCASTSLHAQATSVAPAAGAHAPAALPADSFDLARKYTRWFYTDQIDSLVAHHSPEGQKDPALRDRLKGSAAELTRRAGKEIWLLDERFITRNGNRQYWRTATFSAFSEPLLVRWVINSKGELTGLGLGPKSDAPPIDPAP